MFSYLPRTDNGWAIGYNVNTRSAGIFPRRNVRPIQEDNSSIFPPRQPKYRPVFSEDRVEEYVQSDEIGKLDAWYQVT